MEAATSVGESATAEMLPSNGKDSLDSSVVLSSKSHSHALRLVKCMPSVVHETSLRSSTAMHETNEAC